MLDFFWAMTYQVVYCAYLILIVLQYAVSRRAAVLRCGAETIC
jgi:hypothetical protein